MNIIIPMAGIGKRLRPHTLTIPKPLIPIAGKPIVQRLVEDISTITDEKVDEIGFVTGRFGVETERQLLSIAASVGARGSIHYQDEALGTAHAILCAEQLLRGKVVVAYADTLFTASFKMDTSKEGVIWVSEVEQPEQFGVVKLTDDGKIKGFYEKPKNLISNLAIIGIYFFRDALILRKELQFLLDQKITTGGEYGITDALENMMKKGMVFHTEKVDQWLDCGNKDAVLETNMHLLENLKDMDNLVSPNAAIDDSIIIEPCFIDKDVKISQSVIGPYVSVGEKTVIKNTVIQNSIVQKSVLIQNKHIENSIIGNFAKLTGNYKSYNIGDYNHLID